MAEKKIAGLEIRVDRPLATEALRLQARLMRAAGGLADKLPGILASRREGATEDEKARGNAEAMAALGDVFNRLTPDEYAGLVQDIVGMAKIKRQSGHYDPADLDGDFSNNLGAVLPVAFFVLKETFSDFFSGAQALGGRKLGTH